MNGTVTHSVVANDLAINVRKKPTTNYGKLSHTLFTFCGLPLFACAVKMRAHGAFSDRGTGVVVSPDERRSVFNFGSVFGSL